jgi:hypothetical protein
MFNIAINTKTGLVRNNTSHVLRGQSSPGVLQVGQHPSNATRQIPHTSSSSSSSTCSVDSVPMSHFQCAIACQCFTFTFIMVWWCNFVCVKRPALNDITRTPARGLLFAESTIMAPTPSKVPFVSPYNPSTSTFKDDIFNGKVLFCTGGGSGICRGMVEAMVSKTGCSSWFMDIHQLACTSR